MTVLLVALQTPWLKIWGSLRKKAESLVCHCHKVWADFKRQACSARVSLWLPWLANDNSWERNAVGVPIGTRSHDCHAWCPGATTQGYWWASIPPSFPWCDDYLTLFICHFQAAPHLRTSPAFESSLLLSWDNLLIYNLLLVSIFSNIININFSPSWWSLLDPSNPPCQAVLASGVPPSLPPLLFWLRRKERLIWCRTCYHLSYPTPITLWGILPSKSGVRNYHRKHLYQQTPVHRKCGKSQGWLFCSIPFSHHVTKYPG